MIYLVLSYSDGALVAYKNEEEAKYAIETYSECGLYLKDDLYIEEIYLID